MIDGDGQNIIACLYNSSKNLVWKAMSSEASPHKYQMSCSTDGSNDNCYVIDTTNGTVRGQEYVFSTFGAPQFTTMGLVPSSLSGTDYGKYQISCVGQSGWNQCFVLNTETGAVFGLQDVFNRLAGGGTSFNTVIAP